MFCIPTATDTLLGSCSIPNSKNLFKRSIALTWERPYSSVRSSMPLSASLALLISSGVGSCTPKPAATLLTEANIALLVLESSPATSPRYLFLFSPMKYAGLTSLIELPVNLALVSTSPNRSCPAFTK